MGVCSSTKNLQTNFSPEEIAKAMKESLNLAAKFAEEKTAGEGKFTDNEAIRIALPDELLAIKTKIDKNQEKIEKMMLAKVIDDKLMEDFNVSERLTDIQLQMNKTAEKACIGLADIFIKVIEGMKAENVMELLQGEDKAITEFLRTECEPQLTENMTPIIEKEMASAGLTESWKVFQTKYGELKEKLSPKEGMMGAVMGAVKAVTGIGAMPELEFDMNGYVLTKIMDAIFGFLGDKEAEMKKNPLRISSDLVAGVFKKYCQMPEQKKDGDAAPDQVDLAEKVPLVNKEGEANEAEGEVAQEAVKVEE